MKIPLSKVKGLDRRVRQQMSPEKLEELADSIKDMGVIVPVKVRKNGDGYTLVYGHRRVAAAKMAGLTEIEAIVEDVAENVLLTQSLAENVIREDMAAIDIAKALQQIIDDTGCTQEALGKKLGWGRTTVGSYLEILSPEIKRAVEGQRADFPIRMVQKVRTATKSDKLAGRVIEYAGQKGITSDQAAQVADAVKRASEFSGERGVKQVLAKSYADIVRELPPPPHKVMPRVTVKPPAETLFQWIRDERVVYAEQALKDISALVSEIARSDQDRGGGKHAIMGLQRLTSNVLQQMDDVIKKM